MTASPLPLRGALALAAVGGALLPLALAPFGIWITAPASAALLLASLVGQAPRRAPWIGAAFGLAKYGFGVSWIYVSIHVHGAAPPPLAAFLVVLFAAGMSLFPAAMAWLLARLLAGAASPLRWAGAFVAAWVLLEWLLTWLLTGFPWLFAGYAHIDGPLAGWAPILGVLGLSLISVATGALAWLALVRRDRLVAGLAAGMALVWLAGLPLQDIEWTGPSAAPRQVAMVQGNVDQATKWRRDMAPVILEGYLALSEPHWQADLLIWPEAAITYFLDDVPQLRRRLDQTAGRQGTTLVTGVPAWREDPELQVRYFQNTALALGAGEGRYVKQRLVPFGEYVPLEGVLRGLIAFFDLPMSRARPGPAGQPLLRAGEDRLAMAICYEIVYPELVREQAVGADLLLTLSNDTWFGASMGPHQHMQMARMRALESRRWLLRSTNNGITALVDPQGRVRERLPQFEAGVLTGTVVPRRGLTPFLRFGHWPVLLLCAALIAAAGLRSRRP